MSKMKRNKEKVQSKEGTDKSESGDEDLVLKATGRKVKNYILSDSSDSEDGGLIVKSMESENPSQAASETPIAPLLKPSITGKIKT